MAESEENKFAHSKYNHADFMPKESEPQAETDSSPVQETLPEPETSSDSEEALKGADPEIAVLESPGKVDGWLRYVAMVFSPLLIPTYCMALAMWATPLANINENTRLGATFMVLVLTALAPLTFFVASMRFSHYDFKDFSNARKMAVPVVVFAVCEFVAAYYLYCVKAPSWLFMAYVGAGLLTVLLLCLSRLSGISSSMGAMGALSGTVFYWCREGIADWTPTYFVIALLLVSGLVGSAVIATNKRKISSIALSYALGWVVLYLVLTIPWFEFNYTIK